MGNNHSPCTINVPTAAVTVTTNSASVKSEMNAWLSCLLGIAIGVGGSYVWRLHRGPDPELVAARERIAALTRDRANETEELTQAKNQLALLGISNQNLSERLRESAARVAPAATAIAPTPAAEFPPMPDMRIFRERQLKDESARLKRRLQLTELQAQQLDRIVADGLRDHEKEPIFELATSPWFRKEMERLLTPEQKANFDALEQKDTRARAELSARFELSQVEQAVDISEAQRQAILQKLTERALAAHASDASDPTAPSEPGPDPDPLSRMQAHLDQQLAAVEGILTAPQLEEYRRQLSAKMESMTAVVKASGARMALPQ